MIECKDEEEGRTNLKDEVGRVWMDEITKVGNLPFDLKLISACLIGSKEKTKFI